MAKLSDEQQAMLESLGYERVDEDTDRLRFRNKEAEAEIAIVDVAGQLHFDFSGFDMLGSRTALADLIFSKDLVERLTEESRNGQTIGAEGEEPG